MLIVNLELKIENWGELSGFSYWLSRTAVRCPIASHWSTSVYYERYESVKRYLIYFIL